MGSKLGACFRGCTRCTKRRSRPSSPQASKSLQSFRDIIPQDNRLDLNSATEQQLHTLPGLNRVCFNGFVKCKFFCDFTGAFIEYYC